MAGCSCGIDSRPTIVYSCSGVANVGLLADRVMRTLIADKAAQGSCLAALGADLSGFVESAKSAGANLVLDGCKVGCAAKNFARHGIPCVQYVMTDFGPEKGKTPIDEALVRQVADRVKELAGVQA